MTRLSLVLVILLWSLAMSSEALRRDVPDSEAMLAAAPHLQLDSAYIDLGRVCRDSVAEATMEFVNTGGEPLQILRIFSDCGCTVPSYPEEPVAPGGKGVIRIRFDAKGRYAGSFRKSLRIRTNADNPREVLVVKGIIR